MYVHIKLVVLRIIPALVHVSLKALQALFDTLLKNELFTGTLRKRNLSNLESYILFK